MLLDILFAGLIKNPNIFCIVYPHLTDDYFTDKSDKTIYKTIKTYYTKYEKIPKFMDLKLIIDTDETLTVDETKNLIGRLSTIALMSDLPEEQTIIDEIESWVQNRALELAILDSVEIIESGKPKGGIHQKITDALSIDFKVNVGHDYFEDIAKRYKYYTEVKEKIELDIDVLNTALGGGLEKKALYVMMASTNVGKTTVLCHCASALLKQNQNVLYVSAEMSEEQLTARIDANLLDLDISSLAPGLDKKIYRNRIKNLYESTNGKLIIKEYPTGTANAFSIRTLLHELKIKKGFVPSVVILDGLNNFASYKIPASQTGTALYVKNVAEEMRALTNVCNIAMLSVTQFNRGAKAKKADADLEDVGEAYAISQTVDWAVSIIQTEELRIAGKYIFKLLKTRFGKNKGDVYTVGIDYDKMRLFNLSKEDQELPVHLKDQMKYEQQVKDRNEEKAVFDFS